MIPRDELNQFFESLLEPQRFADYGPNGLQVEGTDAIETVAFAVSATLDSVSRAVAGQAQALVVHHGLFWKFHGPRPLTGALARRIFPLVRHGVNLFAYHLPLDAHPEIGNAASLGRRLGLTDFQPFGDHQGAPTGVSGLLTEPMAAGDLGRRMEEVLSHPVMLASPDENRPVRTLGIITGGANGEWRRAAAEGLDAYITGEMSEHDWHEAQEAGIHMYAGGHHATEKFGIRALMEKVEERFGVSCFYIDSDNPA